MLLSEPYNFEIATGSTLDGFAALWNIERYPDEGDMLLRQRIKFDGVEPAKEKPKKKISDIVNVTINLSKVPKYEPFYPLVTHTAAFEFKDGTVIEIPEPGEGWENNFCYEWPHPHKYVQDVVKKDQAGSGFKTAGIHSQYRFSINHESGRILFEEYAMRMHDEQARVIWVKEWERPETIIIIKEEKAQDPKFEGRWPVRRCSGPIKVANG
jgi:hypothetical protein